MKQAGWQEKLVSLDACDEAVKWAKKHKTFDAAWEACQRGDWMFWLAGRLKIERTLLVRELVRSIRPICLEHSKDERVSECLNVCERWANGEATIEQVRAAAFAAAATDVASTDGAVADVAFAAFAAAATTAATAAFAAAATAAVSARKQTLKAVANHARKTLTKPVMVAWKAQS